VEDGETAAVWLKGEKEATLKKVYRERDRIRLQPANARMKPIYTRPENVEIQGKVVGGGKRGIRSGCVSGNDAPFSCL
jgi:repressor LexA